MTDLFFLLSLSAIVFGVSLIYIPAGIIIGGVFGALVAGFLAYGDKPRKEKQ